METTIRGYIRVILGTLFGVSILGIRVQGLGV